MPDLKARLHIRNKHHYNETVFLYVINGLICLSQIVSAQTWNALGNLNGSVGNILVVENELYVTGGFTNASGNSDADYIAHWDGNSWHAIMSNAPHSISAIVKSGNDLYLRGGFANVGGNPAADCIAGCDGVSWNLLGSGLNGLVVDIAVSGNDVYVVSNFTDAGGNVNADRIAHWSVLKKS